MSCGERASTTLKLPGSQNSRKTWRHTPQGAHQSLMGLPSAPPTTAMATKPRTPSLTALKMAVRSAQLPGE